MSNPGSMSNLAGRGQDWLIRKVNDLEKRINQVQTQRSLESAIIGRGGISIRGGALKILDLITGAVLVVLDSLGVHVKAGGKINVDNGGEVALNDGSVMNVNDNGQVNLNDGSGLTINDGGSAIMSTPADHTIFQLQRIDIPDGSGRNQQVFALGRDDGTIAFALADLGTVLGHAHQQNWAFYDRGANIVFADDTDSGQGIARPLLPLGDWMSNSYPTDTTNSGSFQTLNTLTGYKQQPKVLIQVLARCDDPGTAGEIRVTDQDGNVIGGVATISAGAYVSFFIGPVALPGTHEQPIALNLQGRVTSGTGTIGARGLAAWGQSS